MRPRHTHALLGGLLLLSLLPHAVPADTALGDAGHFLRYVPKMHLLNPDGRAFTLTLHLMRWPVPQWNRGEIHCRLTAPDGTVLLDGPTVVEGAAHTFEVPAGPKGVYLFEMNLPVKHPAGGPDFFVESSLDRSVVWTGDPAAHAVLGRWLLLQCSVPRRWWFWVPRDTRSFTVRTQWVHMYQSQREDWGITVFSPRGQRVRALWGDLGHDEAHGGEPAARSQVVRVPVEPGASGRFWCVEVRFADSHNYSKISLALDGVPPYLARSPEEWFNPETGAPPAIDPYDPDPFMQFARTPGNAAWPHLQHFSPCPALGDPDGAEIRGDAEFALWNPEDRPLLFKVGSYLPRDMGSPEPKRAHVVVTGADGQTVADRQDPIEHLHGDHGAPAPLPATGKGAARVRVSGVERWFAFTYPATPLVLLGQDAGDGWSRFRLEVGTARNWYFHVPRGTHAFQVRAAVQHDTDLLSLEVNAPDRTLAMVYGRQGLCDVAVPPGLDGKTWHLRVDIGSGTVMRTDGGPESRYLGLYTTLELKGVPGLLAPTWEQWFDPQTPAAPFARP